MAGRVALGAPDLTGVWPGLPPNASSLVPDPEPACAGANGSVWVPDYGGARVLEFKPPFSSGEAASIVLGQSTFAGYESNTTATGLATPAGCATDSHGDLWVSDDRNFRVLEYVPPFTDGMAASLVLGQASFTTKTGGNTATTLFGPVGLAFDPQGALWVTDSGNSRVVEYVPPFSTGMAASVVLGQDSFSGYQAGHTASNLTNPEGVDVWNGVVWVADYGNNRVLGFSPPFSTGEGATYLLGQSSFIGVTATGPGATFAPVSVSNDARGDLWVAQLIGNRVTEFLPPFATFESASIAIGQTSLTSTTAGRTATMLSHPSGAFVAATGALWVTDSLNDRVTEYVPSVYHVTFAATGLPSSTNLSVTVGGTAHAGPGPNVSVAEENGSYAWSVPTVPGFQLSPRSGNVDVNGADATVALTVTKVSYSVTFTALGLPAATNWSVTLGGVAHSSPNNGTISFTESNGTYTYTVTTISGYTLTPRLGSVVVNGAGKDVSIGFASSRPAASGGSSGPISTSVTLLLIAVAAAAGLAVGMLLGRRGKGGPTTPVAWSPPTPASPPASPTPASPASGGPPPGAAG